MDNTTFEVFRQAVRHSFTHAGDGLMNLLDAVTSDPCAQSLIEYSLAPAFERHWTSLYASLARGTIDRQRMRVALAQQVRLPPEGERLVLAVDSSSIARPEAYTSADRTCIYIPNLPQCRHPTTCGWQFSTLAVVPNPASSWCFPLDGMRIASTATAAQVAATQLRAVVPLLPVRPLVIGDRGYGSAPFLTALADVACDLLARIVGNRVAFRPAPPPTGARGRQKLDGDPVRCADPTTQTTPDQTWHGTTPTGQPLHVAVWHALHFQQARDYPFSLVRLDRPTATGKKRDPRISWFIWRGATSVPLETVWTTYMRRYSLEHSFRFLKQDLRWTRARVRTPDQYERWTQIVLLAFAQLGLARAAVTAVYRVWERTTRAPTPRQVRRAMAPFLAQVGTPAKPPKVRRKGRGRTHGQKMPPRVRYAVVRSTKKQSKSALSPPQAAS